MKKVINYIFILIMIIGDICLVIRDLNMNNMSRMATYIVLIPLLFIPKLLRKFTKFHISNELEFVYLLFIFLAQFLGSGVNLYKYVPWFDTFTHFVSGILTCFIAIILLHLFHQSPKKKILFNITYILGIVFLVAGLWEFFEFGMDQLTGSNLQHSMETNVTDTMNDMLAAFTGSILFIITYLYEMLTEKKGFVTNFIDSL